VKFLKVNKELEKVYQKMSETLPHRCSGCGTYNQLTHSHLIPRSHSKSLITDINNIRYHCFSCHKKWENGVVAHEMTDFQRNMDYIKSVDEHYFHIRVQKLDKNKAFFLGDYQVK
jgi:5-methylcytosine-specific restriction endonuclease McrA